MNVIELVGYGTCTTIDTVTVETTVYGFNTLWFLYSGMIAFVILLHFSQYVYCYVSDLCHIATCDIDYDCLYK